MIKPIQITIRMSVYELSYELSYPAIRMSWAINL